MEVLKHCLLSDHAQIHHLDFGPLSFRWFVFFLNGGGGGMGAGREHCVVFLDFYLFINSRA